MDTLAPDDSSCAAGKQYLGPDRSDESIEVMCTVKGSPAVENMNRGKIISREYRSWGPHCYALASMY